MLTDEELIAKAKILIEAKLGWGKATTWTNQDFIALSKRLSVETGAAISHITLKRLWGKVKYNGLPQVYTLNTLVQFAGYENWREFVVKNNVDPRSPAAKVQTSAGLLKKPNIGKPVLIAVCFLFAVIGVVWVSLKQRNKIDPADYSFSSRATIKAGIPNSVVFSFNATKAPGDSVIIQQSWDTTRRTLVSKKENQHTLLYEFPGFFEPKLIVDHQIVKEHGLLIPSDGWLTAIVRSPMPVYFKKEDVVGDGLLSLPVSKLTAQNISLVPQPPMLSYCNVRNFGEIYSDNFTFETSVRNDYREGSAVCQTTNIYLLCEGTAICIPLCSKGCESANNFFFTGYSVSGKQKDLSTFGVDFKNFVKVRIESAKGKARVFVDDKLAFKVDGQITKSKIIGIDLVFQGIGSVDYVRLSNQKNSYDDEF